MNQGVPEDAALIWNPRSQGMPEDEAFREGDGMATSFSSYNGATTGIELDEPDGMVSRTTILEEPPIDLSGDTDELRKMRAWYFQMQAELQEEKERAEREAANSLLIQQEKMHLQQQINELQSAAGNMASTAESVHKWLEERTRNAWRECQEEKTRADEAAASVQALTVEKQELVQQLNELHAAADNMVTTAAESVHQLVEERTRETTLELEQEKERALAEA